MTHHHCKTCNGSSHEVFWVLSVPTLLVHHSGVQLQVATTAEMKNKGNVRSQNLATFPLFFALFSLLSKAQGASETRISCQKLK